jgi:lipid A 3-O-deacylase
VSREPIVRRALCVALAVAALLPAAASRGELAAPPDPFHRGGQQLGLLAGGGFGIPIFGARDDRENHTRMFGLFGRWAIGLSDPLARGAFYEGNVELDVEPMVLLNFHPRSGWAAGGSLLLHYNFLVRDDGIVPFIEGGGGASHLAFRLRDQSDGFTFPLQASLGLHYLAFARAALTASVGYYHLSNAGLRYPNVGINAIMVRIGFMAFR